jgi:alpha-L-fucosidase
MKTMLITFFDIKNNVHFEFFPQGQTVNQAYHMEILERLFEIVRRKRPELKALRLDSTS